MVWYLNKEVAEAGKEVSEIVSIIKSDQTGLVHDWTKYISLYKDKYIAGFSPGEWFTKVVDKFRESNNASDNWLTHNVLRSCIDTVVAKITAHQPKAKFLTSGAFEETQEKAKNLEKFVDGVVYAEEVYQKAILAFRDACICGTGILKIFCDGNKVKVERIHVSRIKVDCRTVSTSDKIDQIFQTDFVSRTKLKQMFKTKSEQIEAAPSASEALEKGLGEDVIEVTEAWRTSCKDKPGRHMILIGDEVLLDEEWTEALPFVVIRFSDDILGWYGVGLGEQLAAIQMEINEVVQKVQDNMNLLAVPYILKHKGTNIPDEFLGDNTPAKIIEWEGQIPPRVETPPGISPQVIQYLENLYRKAFEIARVSMLSAAAQKPAGLNSGIAIRTFHDIETQNFAPIARAWEKFFVDVATHIVGAIKQAASNDEELEVTYLSNNKFRKIKWSEVDMEEDQYELQVTRASSLPASPSGRLERIVEMVKSGMVSLEEARSLLDFPDLEKYNRLANASIDDLEALFEHMLIKGTYIEPSKYQNLELGLKLGVSYLIRAKLDGVGSSKTDLIERWLDEANALIEEAQMAMLPPAAPEGIAPGGPVPQPEGPKLPQGGV